MGSFLTSRLVLFLSVLSLVAFWLMPVAPFLSLAAVSTTKNTTGWARTLAVLAAVFCSTYTAILAMLFVAMIIR